MPRTKKALVEKMAALAAEEKMLLAEKQRLREERERLRRQKDKKIREWDFRYRPKPGVTILYQEGEDQFIGPVTHSKRFKDGTYDFEVSFVNYSNHRDESCKTAHNKVRDEGRYQYLSFNERYLVPKRGVPTCYADVYVRHLRGDEDYPSLIIKTYAVGRKNVVFPSKKCWHGDRCTNKKVGHLINFSH